MATAPRARLAARVDRATTRRAVTPRRRRRAPRRRARALAPAASAFAVPFAVLAAAFFRGVKGSVVLERHAHVETSLVMIAPYCAYAAAEFLQLSGIVAILFCGGPKRLSRAEKGRRGKSGS